MAFTFCTNCGEQIDVSLEKCPYCGQPTGAQKNYTYGMDPTAVNRQSQSAQSPQNDPNSQPPQNPQNGGDPAGSEQRPPEGNGSPYGQNPYRQNPYAQNPYGQNPYGQSPYGDLYRRPVMNKRPMSTGLMVFSILNIVFGCCCFGMVFGIIGLVFALQAQNATSDIDEIRKKKLSLAMNVIGTVLTIAYVVSYVVVFISVGGDLSMLM